VLPKLTDYWDTAQDTIPRFAGKLSALAPGDAEQTMAEVQSEVTAHVRVCPDEQLRTAAVVVAEELYRAAATIAYWDPSMPDYLACSAATFFELLAQRGYQLHYVVDNYYEDLQRPTQLFPVWFQACGLAYLCPQAAALDLMGRDGVPEADRSASLGKYIGEARMLSAAGVDLCRTRGRHFAYLESDFEEGSLDAALAGRGAAGVISVFRNEAPLPGSTVTVVYPA
jgi:hypothetical protein